MFIIDLSVAVCFSHIMYSHSRNASRSPDLTWKQVKLELPRHSSSSASRINPTQLFSQKIEVRRPSRTVLFVYSCGVTRLLETRSHASTRLIQGQPHIGVHYAPPGRSYAHSWRHSPYKYTFFAQLRNVLRIRIVEYGFVGFIS